MVAALRLAAALASLALAGGTGQIGEGAGRLTPQALEKARAKWGPNVCLAAIEVAANVDYRCTLSGEHSGAINSFEFRIFNPDRPYDWCYVGYREAVTAAPVCIISPGPPPLDEWETTAGTNVESHDAACLSGMKIESGQAIAIAVKAGLAAGQAYIALLAEAGGPESGFWKFKKLREKTFWEIRAQNAPDTYIVDAMTGKLLLRRKGFIRFYRKTMPD